MGAQGEGTHAQTVAARYPAITHRVGYTSEGGATQREIAGQSQRCPGPARTAPACAPKGHQGAYLSPSSHLHHTSLTSCAHPLGSASYLNSPPVCLIFNQNDMLKIVACPSSPDFDMTLILTWNTVPCVGVYA